MLRSVLLWAGAALMVALAYRSWGWSGVGLAVGGLFLWLLLHFTRLMHVLKRTADRPIGHVGSAVMLHSRLKPGQSLLHVLALTRALGEQISPRDDQPEVFRWTDATTSSVTCEFTNGKLVRWTLDRPVQTDGEAPQPAGSAAP